MTMALEQIEKHWQQRASKLSIAEVEAELERLPTSPKTDDEIVGRASLMRRYLELTSAGKPNPPPDPAGLIEVVVPEGGATCVQSLTIPRKFYYATMQDGRAVIRMPWRELSAIIFGTSGTDGPSGGLWLAANPHLQARFPQNPPPPLAAAPE